MAWLSCNDLVSTIVVILRRAQLVLAWVTISFAFPNSLLCFSLSPLQFLAVHSISFAVPGSLFCGKSKRSSCHPRSLGNWLISVELVLLCMFQTNLLRGNCRWLISGSKGILGGD